MRKLNLNELNEVAVLAEKFINGLTDAEVDSMTPATLGRFRDLALLVAPSKFR